MRIFIPNYNLNSLSSKLKLLEIYLVNTTTQYEVFSNDGIFQIDGSNTYRFTFNDKCVTLCKNYSNNFDILVDHSVISKVKSCQIPVDSIIIPTKNNYYSLFSNSKLKLLIQMKQEESSGVTLLDFYFIINEEMDINSIFIKDELNVFLSLLN
jgi:hypothetical protein